jgi:hypothetical protein
VTGGEEALVFQNGGCLVSLEPFLGLLKSYSKRKNITIEVDENSLHVLTSSLSINDYTVNAAPPADFIVGRVTDTWVAGNTTPTLNLE